LALAGWRTCPVTRSGLVDAVHQARGIEQSRDLVDELFDVEHDLDRFFDIAGLGAAFGRFGDTGCLIEALAHFRKMRCERDVEQLDVHGGVSFPPAHTLCCL